MKNLKVVVTTIVAVLLLFAAFICGAFVGRDQAYWTIKSELVWYNEFQLREAIKELKSGELDSAEVRIGDVARELDKMKNASK